MKIYNLIVHWYTDTAIDADCGPDSGCNVQSFKSFEQAYDAFKAAELEDEEYGILNTINEKYKITDICTDTFAGYGDTIISRQTSTKDGKYYIRFELDIVKLG